MRALGPGWKPLAAPDPHRALAVARTFRPRLVVATPDSLSLVGPLRADLRTGHLPVLALASGDDDQLAALEAGADAVLPPEASPDLLRAAAYRLLVSRDELRRRWSHRAALALEHDGGGDTLDDHFLRRLQREAEGVLGAPASGVPELARALALSPRQLTRRLKALTGESPGAFLRRVRLGRAAALLREGATVKEAAAAVGYGSRPQFSRAFRGAFGADPSAFIAPSRPLPPESTRQGSMSENGSTMSDF